MVQTLPESDDRPWGSFTVLDEDDGYKVKRIVVSPGRRLSYQTHAARSEHWTIVRGRARITLDGREISLAAGESIDIAVGSAHRVENPGEEDLVLIEVQQGNYLEEDDIVRLEDDYGRA